ncbi:hypothetical protein GLAREA_07726 [Glarea lozoyensis ATCC 20868]|uniref:Uncharacterized protein n=1 Tax=Glarea lozoyensis (strain ATCC 20868 / MF5171) TaxID=1116229 RepID=S3D217_GLAL2|nr:uncharacterized protein GLAREA_07726 [Glarea lozoyensis ATCC 20868]EPE32592.1 hypothetical protein GLAREA_07726 [Glarea lozoyensis ATCC 20868]
MSHDPSSFQVSTTSTFPQQGQVDWVAFGGTVYSLTASTLQRFSSAGVQPATYAAGIALASRFKVGSLGEKRVEDAIQNLSGVPGFDKILYFGFGHRSFVKLLAEDPNGSDLIALCSCLGEMHSETVTAWVLRELWSVEGFPDDYKPPHSQFMALARACAGVLTRTSFSNTVSGMHLQAWDDHQKSAIMVSPATDIARVLSGMFKISRGEVDNITIFGYSECAFIAGLAQWLFNFTIRVEHETGRLIYTNTPEHETAQVTLRYSADVDFHHSSMMITNTTYVLRSHTALLIQTPDESLLKLSLRAPWDECLSRLFGVADFNDRLIKHAKMFGGFLGSIARIYEAVAKGEMELESEAKKSESESNYKYLSEATYGRGFSSSIVSILPELKSATGFLESLDLAIGVTLDIARRDIEFHLRSLQSLCSCLVCHPHMLKWHSRCLVVVAFTLYHLVLIVANVDYPEGLDPTLSGLEEVYQSCISMWANFGRSQPPKGHQTWEYCLDKLRVLSSNELNYRKEDDFQEPVHGSLASAFLVFAGIWPRRSTINGNDCYTGLCSVGLCFYQDSLRFLSSSAELAQKIHIIPGHIEWQDRSYDAVVDSLYHESLRPTLPKAVFEGAVDTIPEDLLRTDEVSVTPLIAERSTEREVTFYYKASIPDGTIYIQPGFSTRHILRSTGRTSCDKPFCSSLPWPCTFVRRGWDLDREFHDNLHYQNGVACCVWEFRDDFARCAALAALYNSQESGKRKTTYLLRTGECVSCCVRALLARDWSLTNDSKGLKQGVVHIL